MRKVGVKLIYSLLALSFVAFLTIVLLSRYKPSEQKGRPVATETVEAQTEEDLPQKEAIAPPFKLNSRGTIRRDVASQNEYPEEDDIYTMQGEVTIIDWCFGTFIVDGVTLDMGSLDLTGRGIETGDRVEVTYREGNRGKVIHSVKVLR